MKLVYIPVGCEVLSGPFFATGADGKRIKLKRVPLMLVGDSVCAVARLGAADDQGRFYVEFADGTTGEVRPSLPWNILPDESEPYTVADLLEDARAALIRRDRERIAGEGLIAPARRQKGKKGRGHKRRQLPRRRKLVEGATPC